jgi:phosphoribosyl 1,2-cyclic phosphodiesterase/CheY-like chemotaxis protein
MDKRRKKQHAELNLLRTPPPPQTIGRGRPIQADAVASTVQPMKSSVRVQFWGTRGSLAKPGRNTVRHGGNTSCVQVTSPNGSLVVIDCGTGAHDLGQALMAGATGPLRGSILISHTHWDHIQGFPFFAPLFVPGGQWDIYGPAGLGRSLRDTLAGQMEHTYFPVTLDEMGAAIRFHDLGEGSFEIDDIRIATRYLNHPALTLGYRMEMGGTRIVYACDHEPYSRTPGQNEALHELDRRHSEFLAGADLVIHDAQFTDKEYASHKGWGHSPVEYVSELCRLGGVKRVAFSHHDPGRTDDALDEVVESVRNDLKGKDTPMEVFAAADGQVVEFEVFRSMMRGVPGDEPSAIPAAAQALKDSSVILGISDAKIAVVLAEAARSAGVRTTHVQDGASAVRMAKSAPPALILLEDQPAGIEGLSVCKQLRADHDPRVNDVPIIIVADRERTGEGLAAGVTRWLITPFSAQYARAQIQAWLMSAACRWTRAALPADEEKRLAALRDLAILDTRPEERFDRITRLAAAIGEVPIVLVSLVDRDRQWFKSCQGLGVTETSREASFCAHAVVSRAPLIVTDTLLDDRFADSPLVVGEPRIRFYAGFPIFHANGRCMGTLCMIDTRPRQFPAATLQRFEDLAGLVEQELNSSPRPAAG